MSTKATDLYPEPQENDAFSPSEAAPRPGLCIGNRAPDDCEDAPETASPSEQGIRFPNREERKANPHLVGVDIRMPAPEAATPIPATPAGDAIYWFQKYQELESSLAAAKREIADERKANDMIAEEREAYRVAMERGIDDGLIHALGIITSTPDQTAIECAKAIRVEVERRRNKDVRAPDETTPYAPWMKTAKPEER